MPRIPDLVVHKPVGTSAEIGSAIIRPAVGGGDVIATEFQKKDPGMKPLNSMSEPELERLSQILKVKVKRQDGQEGKPTRADYLSALKGKGDVPETEEDLIEEQNEDTAGENEKELKKAMKEDEKEMEKREKEIEEAENFGV